MKAITLRNVPHALAERIEEESAQRGTSLNKTVIKLLEEALLPSNKARKELLHHDLDGFVGSWSKQEGNAFDHSLKAQRKIDEDVWR